LTPPEDIVKFRTIPIRESRLLALGSRPVFKRLCVLEYGFSDLKLTEIISYVTPANKASARVMEKLGMIKEEKSFQHPYMKKKTRCLIWHYSG